MPKLEVTAVDLGILLAYVVATRLLFGRYSARKTRGEGAEAYFLAGRELRWPIIGLSFYVANMSGGSFVGLPGSGYNDGIAGVNTRRMRRRFSPLFAGRVGKDAVSRSIGVLARSMALLASGQITMRRVDGWQTLDRSPTHLDLAA